MHTNLVESILDRYRQISEDHSKTVTKTYFNEKYAYRDIPVVFRQAFQQWPVREKWYPTYLDDTLGYKEFNLCSRDGEQEFSLGISTYMNIVEDEAQQKLNYLIENIGFDHPLRKDYDTPKYFRCWYQSNDQAKHSHAYLYAGGAGTFTDTHLDKWSTSAWNYLLKGTKIWFIFPERFYDIIARDPEPYSLHSLVQYAVSDGSEADIRPLVCIQRAGDMVFTPGKCWHAVYNVEPFLALTDNFINETNYEVAKESFRLNLGLKPQQSLNKLIAQGFKNLKTSSV